MINPSDDTLQNGQEYGDILNKLDALINRQHDEPAVPRVHIPSARQIEYPVLTDVVETDPIPIPILTEAIAPEEELEFSLETEPESPPYQAETAPAPSPVLSHALPTGSLSPELQSLIDQRILEVLEKRFSQHIAAAIDKALSVMLDQFSVHLEEVAREAVAEEIQKQLADILPNQNKL
ncbi:MAG: hypothetical protein Q8O37_11605 [Sulfuricellaceae bacterium]|nr:hypothetical protein [Sulfuricellaceae bacterium]